MHGTLLRKGLAYSRESLTVSGINFRSVNRWRMHSQTKEGVCNVLHSSGFSSCCPTHLLRNACWFQRSQILQNFDIDIWSSGNRIRQVHSAPDFLPFLRVEHHGLGSKQLLQRPTSAPIIKILDDFSRRITNLVNHVLSLISFLCTTPPSHATSSRYAKHIKLSLYQAYMLLIASESSALLLLLMQHLCHHRHH